LKNTIKDFENKEIVVLFVAGYSDKLRISTIVIEPGEIADFSVMDVILDWAVLETT